MISFEFRGTKYPINLNYWEAINVLPEKYGISLTKIFTDAEAAEKTMQGLVLDDELTLELAWHYIQETASFDKEEFFKHMQGKDLDRFREDFWSAVINFSPPLKKNLMEEMWRQFKKDMKKVELQNETSDV